MIEKSVFTKIEIIKQIKNHYNIVIERIEIEKRGSANIYYLYDNTNNKYVLKEFEAKYNEKNIIKEIEIINHMKKYYKMFTEYILTCKGDYYFKYKQRINVLMKYIDGYIEEPNTGNIEQTIESANLLGKIIKALEDYKYMEEENIDKWYNKTKIKNGKKCIQELNKRVILDTKIDEKIKQKILKDIEDKIEIIEHLEHMQWEGMENVTHKNSHGDFSVMQFIYNKGKVVAILDFEKARAFPIGWEIIRSYTYIDEKCKNGHIDINNLVLYVKEIMKYIKLNKYDLQYMPYLYLIQLVTSTFGYNEYINNNDLNNLLEFAFWRTEMSRYLFKNLKYLSEELLKII